MKPSEYILLYIVSISIIYASVGIMMEAHAGGKNWGATKPYSREQQIIRGEITETPLTAGRLAWRKIVNGSLVCIYIGAGNSNQTIFTGKRDTCMGTMRIPYNPDEKFVLKIAVEKILEQDE